MHLDESADPREILAWAVKTFAGKVAASCSFQTYSIPLLHMISRVRPRIPILFLDTGYHFPETLAFRDRLVQEWNLELRVIRASAPARSALLSEPTPPYQRDPDRCCEVNKVAPMRAALADFDAWISGVRRDQSETRRKLGVIERTAQGVVRIHPILSWSFHDVRRYIQDWDLPAHPLTTAGYPSIGCAPCTRQVGIGEDERAGRWDGISKTECGLHLDVQDSATPRDVRVRELPVLRSSPEG